LTLLFFALLFVGACAGSTSGGIKVIRHLVFLKNAFLELKRLLHPRAIIRIKVDRQLVAPRVLTHIMVFMLLYFVIFVTGSVIMSMILWDFDQPIITSMGAVATSLGNVGPAIGQVGPVDNFAAIPGIGKWALIFLMLLGRLELFTILILFTPYFWRTN
ncbi:MAG: TrkH family potassium uptake protein, partial [Sinomicrobium sp.]|nr:TrkH family potassium uptake protein [Sinomicrobium sp.]